MPSKGSKQTPSGILARFVCIFADSCAFSPESITVYFWILWFYFCLWQQSKLKCKSIVQSTFQPDCCKVYFYIKVWNSRTIGVPRDLGKHCIFRSLSVAESTTTWTRQARFLQRALVDVWISSNFAESCTDAGEKCLKATCTTEMFQAKCTKCTKLVSWNVSRFLQRPDLARFLAAASAWPLKWFSWLLKPHSSRNAPCEHSTFFVACQLHRLPDYDMWQCVWLKSSLKVSTTGDWTMNSTCQICTWIMAEWRLQFTSAAHTHTHTPWAETLNPHKSTQRLIQTKQKQHRHWKHAYLARSTLANCGGGCML